MKKILDRVNSPEDLKKLNPLELKKLAADIRDYLIEVVSETGGHLSSNLGVVELSIALHYVFKSPYDKIVWDVGHQSYVHKILTGRKEALRNIRQKGGISGFPKRNESVHDAFDVGHSSTSISGALGYAVGRDLAKQGNSVVAVIGDGALTAGMALEALNNGSSLKSNFIVILNDNQMSIDKNVGGLAKYLDTIRTGNVYRLAKRDVQKMLDLVPVVGKPIARAVKDVKDGIKQVLVPGMFFEEMGYTYLGPVDGHDLGQTITVLNQAKRIQGPVLVHLNTVKGKGYVHAEKNPMAFHGVKPFDKENGISKLSTAKAVSYSQILGDTLIEYARDEHCIAAISAAMPTGTGLSTFAQLFPKRFYDVGIAEQHAVTFAAGLGLQKIKPFVAIYSSFLQRAYDQVLHDVCIQKVPVVFLLDRAGVVGEDGETHHGLYDLSFLNHMPNMSIMAPRDGKTYRRMLDYSLAYHEGPIAIRYPRGNAPMLNCFNDGLDNAVDWDKKVLQHGKAEILGMGEEIAIVAVGSMVEIALQVREQMAKIDHKKITVVDAVFIKPMDSKMIHDVAQRHNHLVVIEENAKIGGYGSEVIGELNGSDCQCQIHHFAIEDHFISHGTRNQLLAEEGLSFENIYNFIKQL